MHRYPSTCWMVQRLTSKRLAQLPLAHTPRPLPPDVLPLLLGQAGPPTGKLALGPRLGLARDRALSDGVSPPLAEGEHHRELELASGIGGVEVFREEWKSTPLCARPRSPAARRSAVQAAAPKRTAWAEERLAVESCHAAQAVAPEETISRLTSGQLCRGPCG